MTRIQLSSFAAIGAFVVFASTRAPAAPANDEAPAAPSKEFACGDKGKPPCPTQAWMKANMGPAAANGDADALAKALDYVASHAPKDFPEWEKISKDGADAARKKDLDGAKKSCKSCHDKYKAKYKDEVRDRAF